MKRFLIATLATTALLLSGCQNEHVEPNTTTTKPQQSQQSTNTSVSVSATGSQTGTQELKETHLKVSNQPLQPTDEPPVEIDLSTVYDASAVSEGKNN